MQSDAETPGDLRASKHSPCDDRHGRWSMNTVRKTLLSTSILLALLLCAAAPRLHAEDLDRCQRRVAHAEHELHEAIERHGHHSKQANHDRRELHNVRERACRGARRAWE